MAFGVTEDWHGPEVARLLRAEADAMARDLAERLVEIAREECPVDEGTLRASHHIEPGRDDSEFVISADTPYAAFVHDGTRGRPGNPWMDRALARLAQEAKQILGAE